MHIFDRSLTGVNPISQGSGYFHPRDWWILETPIDLELQIPLQPGPEGEWSLFGSYKKRVAFGDELSAPYSYSTFSIQVGKELL